MDVAHILLNRELHSNRERLNISQMPTDYNKGRPRSPLGLVNSSFTQYFEMVLQDSYTSGIELEVGLVRRLSANC